MREEPICGVYAIHNTQTNDVYVGSAVDMVRRWGRHKSELKHGNHINLHLQRAYDKYGQDKFEYLVLEVVAEDVQCVPTEQRWIDTLKPAYNLQPTAGSNLGYHASETTKRRQGESIKQAWQDPIKRERLLDGVRARAASSVGKPLQESHRKNIAKETRAALDNPQSRLAMSLSHTGMERSTAEREALGKRSAEKWKDPDYRAKFSATRRKPRVYIDNSPEADAWRAAIAAKKQGVARADLAARNADPEYQAKAQAGIQAYWNRKRAEKLARQIAAGKVHQLPLFD